MDKKDRVTKLREELDKIQDDFLDEFKDTIPESNKIFDKLVEARIFTDYDLGIVIGTLSDINSILKTIYREELKEEAESSYQKASDEEIEKACEFISDKYSKALEQLAKVEHMGKINSFRNEYAFLSNFYTAPIIYNGLQYQNNEAAFQAQKCANWIDRVQFSELNPSEAKHLGRKVNLRKDWEQIKVREMTKIVHEKFEQHPDLAEKLVETDTMYLEEGNDWNDKIWGTVNGQGQNLLGQILMKEREKQKELLLDNEIER